jgi:hypothetical protein
MRYHSPSSRATNSANRSANYGRLIFRHHPSAARQKNSRGGKRYKL